MGRFIAAASSVLLSIVALFPPMRVRVEYLDQTEYELALRPVWETREWTVGQVAYTAEVHTGLAVAIGAGIVTVGVLAYAIFDPS